MDLELNDVRELAAADCLIVENFVILLVLRQPVAASTDLLSVVSQQKTSIFDEPDSPLLNAISSLHVPVSWNLKYATERLAVLHAKPVVDS